MNKTVGICGYGYSGSGAVVDLLSSCNEVNYVSCGEFVISYLPDGLEDLRFHLTEGHSRFLSSDIALLRFIDRMDKFYRSINIPNEKRKIINKYTLDFVDKITDVSWKGYWKYDYQETLSSPFHYVKYRINEHYYDLLKKITRGAVFYPEREMRLSINPHEFIQYSREYVHNVLVVLGYKNGKINILDQVFSADCPSKSFDFFENPYAIIVNRDPRDVYLLAKKVLSWQSLWMPTNDVKSFVKYYKCIRDNEEKSTSNILRLNFEDLVYNFQETKLLLSAFLDISPSSLNNDVFKPEVSINNTQLYYNATGTVLDEILYIEDALKEYIIDFSKYSMTPNRNTPIF